MKEASGGVVEEDGNGERGDEPVGDEPDERPPTASPKRAMTNRFSSMAVSLRDPA